MGRLTLVLESEVKPFDMYGFGGNPAGLYRSEFPRTTSGDSAAAVQTSVLELYVPGNLWRDAGEPPYEWALGNPVPGQVQRCFPHYMQDLVFEEWYHMKGDFIPYVPFAERPSGFSWRYRGAFAFAVRGAWSYAKLPDYQAGYISTAELGLAAAVPLGPVDLGLDLPASLTTNTWPYIREQSACIGYRLGVVVPLRMLQLGAVVYEDCPQAYADIPPIVTGWISTGSAGGFALQVLFQPADWLKLGAAGGQRYASTGPVFTSPWASLRAESRPENLPILAALNAEWTRMRTSQPEMDIDQMDSIGIGAGLGAKVWRLMGGAELHYTQRTYQEDTGVVRNPNWVANVGSEFGLGAFQVRLGYEHEVRPIVDLPGYGFNKYTGTAGLGLNIASVRADVAWNHSYWPFGKEVEDEVHLDLKRGW